MSMKVLPHGFYEPLFNLILRVFVGTVYGDGYVGSVSVSEAIRTSIANISRGIISIFNVRRY